MPLLLGDMDTSGFSTGMRFINNNKLWTFLDEDLPALF